MRRVDVIPSHRQLEENADSINEGRRRVRFGLALSCVGAVLLMGNGYFTEGPLGTVLFWSGAALGTAAIPVSAYHLVRLWFRDRQHALDVDNSVEADEAEMDMKPIN